MKRRRIILGGGIVLLLAGAGVFGYFYYVRHVNANFRTVIDGQVYRSGQPSSRHLKDWKERFGIRTVINLRGAREGAEYEEELGAVKSLGLKLIDIERLELVKSGTKGVRALVGALDSAQRPVLLHCGAGVDRTGVASAIAAMYLGGMDFRTACGQIGSKDRALGTAGEGAAAALFEYDEYCRGRGLDPGGWAQFQQWLVEVRKDGK